MLTDDNGWNEAIKHCKYMSVASLVFLEIPDDERDYEM